MLKALYNQNRVIEILGSPMRWHTFTLTQPALLTGTLSLTSCSELVYKCFQSVLNPNILIVL